MLKKPISALVYIIVLLFAFSACAKNEIESAINISGLNLSDEVLIYYLDKVSSSPEKYGLNENSVSGNYIDAAEQLCAEYAAVNTEFQKRSLALDTEHKTEISGGVSNEWRIYSSYYNKIGVSKQTLTKIKTSFAKRDVLFNSYYGEGGSSEVPEKVIKDYFYANYVGFFAVNGYMTATDETGKTVSLDDDEKAKLRAKFNSMLSQLNNGQTIDEVGAAYAKEQDSTFNAGAVNLLKKDSSEYPEGFYEKVAALDSGKSAVIEAGDYIFLVVKADMSKDDDTYFNTHRSACLKQLKSAEFDGIISSAAQSYKITENTERLNSLIEKYKTTQREGS